ncbi:MAG: hypothetical protein AB7P20_22220, partial [Rhizobiaceae bacterium]
TFPRLVYCVIMVNMAKQETVLARKRRGPAPTGINPMIGVRMPKAEIEAVDRWRAEQPDKPSRPIAIRRLVDLGLKRRR